MKKPGPNATEKQLKAYEKYLDGKAKRNKAARARKAAKVAELEQKAKQSNRAIEYTREEWLMEAVRLLRPIFAERGYIIPEKVKAAVGFPLIGARKQRVGECHCSTSSAGGFHEMFISPVLEDTMQIMGTLVHELGHACVGVKHGHRAPFLKFCKALNLEGKATATTTGEPFARMIAPVLADLGPLPHKALSLPSQKKQPTRMLKVECPCCGFKFRAAKAPLQAAAQRDGKGYYLRCVSPMCGDAAPTRIYLDLDFDEEGEGEEE